MNVRFNGIEVELGGKAYVIAPLPLRWLEQNQKRLAEVDSGSLPISLVLEAMTVSLKRNYPEMTDEEVGDLVDISNMGILFQCAMDAAGLQRKALLEQQPGKLNPVLDLATLNFMPTSQPAPDGQSST